MAMAVAAATAGVLQLPTGGVRVLHGAIDFLCDSHDESEAQMRADSQDPECCCRIKKSMHERGYAESLCSKLPTCFAMDQSQVWATLKARPRWWTQAPGVQQCIDLNSLSSAGGLKKQLKASFTGNPLALWSEHRCDDYIHGAPPTEARHNRLVIDVGFHTGEDSMHYVQMGYNVVAIEANAALAQAGVRRPLLAVAESAGQLHVINAGIAKKGNATLSFYVHRKHSERSTFLQPPADTLQRGVFTTVQMPTLTCAAVIRKQPAVLLPPYYMKVDIEGADQWCLHSLSTIRRSELPRYVSTEDPMSLRLLENLGYKRFKLVDQSLSRRGRRSFSGGLPERAPSRDPQWPGGAMGNLSHRGWYTADAVRADVDWQRIKRTGKQRMLHEYDLHARLSVAQPTWV